MHSTGIRTRNQPRYGADTANHSNDIETIIHGQEIRGLGIAISLCGCLLSQEHTERSISSASDLGRGNPAYLY